MSEAQELVTAQEAAERRMAAESTPAPPPVVAESAAILGAIQQAARDPNFDVEKLRALREIQRDWQAEQNEKAFSDALARAQAVMPVVRKNRHVYFQPQGKAPTDYHHADYGELVKTIKPALSAEGLSFAHEVSQQDGKITVSCILRGYGHTAKVTMTASPEGSPGMNEIQKVKSSVTYLRRATLEAVTGAATADDDDDGRGASGGRKAPAPGTPPEVDQMFPIRHPDEAAANSWVDWGKKMAESIKQADTPDALAAIWDDNKDAFANCEGSAPKIHERLVKRTEDRAAELVESAPAAF